MRTYSWRKHLVCHVPKLVWLVATVLIFTCLRMLQNFKDERKQIYKVGVNSYVGRHLLREGNTRGNHRCVDLHDVNSSQRCQFVKDTSDCNSEDGFIQYIRLPYCALSNVTPLAFTILILWLIFLFILVGITADDYFCPALKVISDALNLSPNVAGVTFLAYGNGAPDIFSALAAFVNNKKTGSLAVNGLIGAGTFVTTVVVGAVSLAVSCDLNQRPYLRDVLFYLGALAWMVIIIHKKKITMYEAIGFIVLYVIYVLIVIIGRVVYQRYKRRLASQTLIQERSSVSYENETIPCARNGSIPEITYGYVEQQEERQPLLENPEIDVEVKRSSPIRNVLGGLLSFSTSEFVDSGIAAKIYTVIKIPIQFCLNLTVPVIEIDAEDHNWNKWLQVLQCIFTPLFCLFAAKGGMIMLGGKFPLAALVTILGTILAVVVALTSRPNTPPKYHKLFAAGGFVASVIWIFATATEILNLLKTFGIAFKLSNEILGVTLLSWGNSIADFIANLAVARQGFPQMAIAACFGGSLLDLLLGVGLACTIATSRNGTYSLNTSPQDYISSSFLAVSLVTSAIVVPLLGFRIPKWYGVYLILLYLAFVTLSVLNETNVLFRQ